MPYETWIVPKQHNCDFVGITEPEYTGLAEALKHTLQQMRRLLNDPPFNYLIHTAPFRRPRAGYWASIQFDYHWHLEVPPPAHTARRVRGRLRFLHQPGFARGCGGDAARRSPAGRCAADL